MAGIGKEMEKQSDHGAEGGDIDLWAPLETKTPYAIKQLLEDGRKVIMFAPNDLENPFNWSLVSILALRTGFQYIQLYTNGVFSSRK